MFIAEVGKLSMVGKSEVWIIVDSGKLSRESDGREICSRKKDVAPNFDFWFSHSWDWFTPWALRGVSNQKVAKTISDQGLILEGFLMLKV